MRQAGEGAAATRGYDSRGNPLRCETTKELLTREGETKKGDHRGRVDEGRAERQKVPRGIRGSEVLKESDTPIAGVGNALRQQRRDGARRQKTEESERESSVPMFGTKRGRAASANCLATTFFSSPDSELHWKERV